MYILKIIKYKSGKLFDCYFPNFIASLHIFYWSNGYFDPKCKL